jgi:hypothetical protein
VHKPPVFSKNGNHADGALIDGCKYAKYRKKEDDQNGYCNN